VRIVGEGVAAVQDVDRVAKEALGFRIGPFELFDLTGLDVSYRVLTQIYHQYFEEPRFRPHPLLTRQFAAGLYGRKNGRGFYAYEGGSRIEPPEAVFEGGAERPVWIADRGEDGGRLKETLAKLGLQIRRWDQAACRERDRPHTLWMGRDLRGCPAGLGTGAMHGDRHDGVAGEPHHHHADGPPPGQTYRDSLHGMLSRRGWRSRGPTTARASSVSECSPASET